MDNNTNRVENFSLIIISIVIVLLISAGIAWFFTYKKSHVKPQQPKVVKEGIRNQSDNSLKEKKQVIKSAYELDVEKFNRFFPSSVFKNYLDNVNGPFDLLYFKRAVRYIFQGDYLADLDGVSWESLEKTKKEALSLGRKLMSNPEFVKDFYNNLKPYLLKAVKHSNNNKKTIAVLKQSLKFFNREIDGETLALFKQHYSYDAKLFKEIQKRKYSKTAIANLTLKTDKILNSLKARGYNENDIYLYQFTMRRKAEGGNSLLDAYAFVINDLISELNK
jgi:hypothetical protein